MASATAGGVDTFTRYSGTATAQGRDTAFLYREQHVLHFHDGKIAERVVLYTCRNGLPFARKTVSYGDRFSPDFVLEDASNGMRQGASTEGGQREVFFRKDRVSKEKEGTVPRETGSVADSGFDAFVRANWQPLMDGDAVGMKFLVPSRLQEMRFKVEHNRSAQIGGIPVEVFRLKLSGILGWVTPHIDVFYSAADHVLMRYEGVSDLRDGSDNNYVANIDFRPGDGQGGDDAALAAARGARLAPCH